MTHENATWDLTPMFASTNAWREGLTAVQNTVKELTALQGEVTVSADKLYQALQLNDSLGEQLAALFVYAKMYFDQNMSNGEAKDIYETIDSAYTNISEELSFFEPELLTMTPDTYRQYTKEKPELGLYDFLMEGLERIYLQ